MCIRSFVLLHVSASLRLKFHFGLHLLFLTVLSLGQGDITSFDGDVVSVRGYLHHAENNLWVLTPESNTPSCCVAAPHKTEEQIFLEGVFTSSSQPVTLQGLLKVNGSHPKFMLLEPQIVATNTNSFPWISISLAAILFSGFIYKKKYIDR